VAGWIDVSPKGGIIIRVFVQPRASRSEVVGLHGEPPRLKIRVAARPVEGEANEEVLRFVAKSLGLPKSAVELTHGEASRQKDLWIRAEGSLAEFQIKLLGEKR
jgi:uncharacterized protein (TIGR00251 family)